MRAWLRRRRWAREYQEREREREQFDRDHPWQEWTCPQCGQTHGGHRGVTPVGCCTRWPGEVLT